MILAQMSVDHQDLTPYDYGKWPLNQCVTAQYRNMTKILFLFAAIVSLVQAHTVLLLLLRVTASFSALTLLVHQHMKGFWPELLQLLSFYAFMCPVT